MQVPLHHYLALIVLLITTIASYEIRDYCDDEPNVPCIDKCRTSKICGANAVVEKLTDSERSYLLDRHNTIRSNVADGSFPNMPKAKDMNALSYDKECEFLASCHAVRCLEERANASITARHEPLGQNFYVEKSNDQMSDADLLEMALNTWIEEGQFSNINESTEWIRYYRKMKMRSNFAQMIWSRVKFLGCAKINYLESGEYTYLLFCNYLPAGRFQGMKVYTIGDPTCANSFNQFYTSLCGSIRPPSKDLFVTPLFNTQCVSFITSNLFMIGLLLLCFLLGN